MARSFSPLVLGFAILSTGAGSATAQSIPDMRGAAAEVALIAGSAPLLGTQSGRVQSIEKP